MNIGNIFEKVIINPDEEIFEDILAQDKIKIERIVSYGQSTPEKEWYDQDWDEWVMLLKGSAGLKFENDRKIITMRPGDYIFIPRNIRHRVEFTDKDEASIWLAIHIW